MRRWKNRCDTKQNHEHLKVLQGTSTTFNRVV